MLFVIIPLLMLLTSNEPDITDNCRVCFVSDAVFPVHECISTSENKINTVIANYPDKCDFVYAKCDNDSAIRVSKCQG
jgi:hypothetical protein